MSEDIKVGKCSRCKEDNVHITIALVAQSVNTVPVWVCATCLTQMMNRADLITKARLSGKKFCLSCENAVDITHTIITRYHNDQWLDYDVCIDCATRVLNEYQNNRAARKTYNIKPSSIVRVAAEFGIIPTTYACDRCQNTVDEPTISVGSIDKTTGDILDTYWWCQTCISLENISEKELEDDISEKAQSGTDNN